MTLPASLLLALVLLTWGWDCVEDLIEWMTRELTMTPEESLAFVRLVSGMRHHQRAYFKDRRDGDLAASKDYEKRVDAIVARTLNPQPSLFGGDPK